MTEKDNSSDINYNRIQGENSVFSARCGNESMEDQDLLVATDGTNKVANVDFVHSLLCVSGISSENEVLQPEKSDCLTNCIDKFEHSGDGKTSRGTSKNQDTITKDIWSGNGNTEVPPPIPDGTSVDSESNLKLKNGASRECFSSNSHSPTEDNMSIFTNEAVILKNTSESLNLTTLSENGRRKHDADSDVARNSHEISPKASERADKNNYSEFMCDAVNSTEAQTLDVDNSQLQKAQVESQILMELNHVLTNLGFGFRRDNNTNKCSLQDSNNLRNNVEVGHAKIPFSLQEFSSGLQDQLSKYKLDAEKFRDSHYSEVQSLERAVAQERSYVEQQEAKALQTITQLKNDLEKKHQLLEAANKDREGMVVKYAESEKNVITVRKDLELAERRLREANRARDLLSDRLKIVQTEKEKANNLLETKGQEYSTLNRENQRLKEDLRWTQNKLKAESDTKKEAEQRITDLIRRVEEAKLEAEQARKDAQNAIKAFQESQENKAVTLDQQLREQHARLILERHERADGEAVLKQLQAEVDALKTKQQTLINENNQLSLKVQTLEKERLDSDQRLSRLKQENDKHHQEVADLRERLAGMESLRAQLQQYEDQLLTCRSEMERLRLTNVELQQDAAACREREAELLDFTQKLTEKNVRLQSEFSALEAKTQVLESKQQPLLRKLGDAEGKVESLAQQLDEEQRKRQEENSILARHLAEKTHNLEQVQQQLEDSQGEVEVLKRKHAASIRELTREIQQSRKRQEMSDNSGGSHPSSSSSTSLAQGSRTSSSSSLNTVCETAPSPYVPPITLLNGQEPDRQTLIERLIKLQRENAKRAEKLDFMEEHSQVLVSELQKKTRLIQNFVMKMPAGALSSESMDQNKAELAKRTGIMASMYGSKNDEAMTLELSMEINRKIQAVLEDTLLKNITLKENLDTLGAEIARLSTKTTT